MTTPTAPPITEAEPPPPLITLAPDPSETPAGRHREERAESARADAFQATPFAWRGRILSPWTPSRERAFHAHREAIGAMEWHLALASPNAFLADASRMLYFLTIEPKVWLNFLALQPKVEIIPDPADPMNTDRADVRMVNAHAALEVEIQKWTDANFTGTLEERNTVYALCQDIIKRANLTRARVAAESSGDDSGN